METKDKTRTGSSRQSGRSKPNSGSNTQRRGSQPQSGRQRTSRPEAARSGKTGTAQRRAEPAGKQPSRTAPAAQQRRRTQEQAPRRESTARQVHSEAPEQVFRPAQQSAARTQTPNAAKPRDPQAAKRAAQRRRSAKRTREREIQKKKQANRPAVEYTPAKPINVNRLLLQIAVVLAVALAVVMGLSVFFKVESVMVYGNSAYSAWTVQEAAGIEGGENLMTLNRTRASGKIIASLPYVERARIGIKLPDTVNIYVEEAAVAYAIQSEDGTWWLMTSSGVVLEQIDAGTASNHTKITGVSLSTPVVGEAAKALEQTTVEYETQPDETRPEPTDPPEGESVPVQETLPEPEVKIVTSQERLNAALVILNSLELNQIIGEASGVDVSVIDDLYLWYGQQYEVRLGDASNMDYKISSMKAAIAQQKDYEMGTLDVSFTQWKDQVGFTPAEIEN